MYLRNLHIRNTGPLEKLDLEFDLQDNLNPKPIILVGKNGSGKTYALSYIADAFFEFAKQFYSDVVNGQGYNSPYFKIITGKDINSSSNGGASIYLRFQDLNQSDELHFCQNVGKEEPMELPNLYGAKLEINRLPS